MYRVHERATALTPTRNSQGKKNKNKANEAQATTPAASQSTSAPPATSTSSSAASLASHNANCAQQSANNASITCLSEWVAEGVRKPPQEREGDLPKV